ncbi:MAG: winged helix-turn-helix domain-containing protein [Candidatus Acidiferrales bacterium]
MNEPSPSRRVVSFGVYQCDVPAGELRKNGARVKISDQPFRLLTILLEHPGEMVTRQELGERLWAEGTFVGFEDSLNTAVNKLRTALDDESENPRFIETIPRRGYRFIGPIEEINGSDARHARSVAPVSPSRAPFDIVTAEALRRKRRRAFATILLLICSSLAILGVLGDWFLRGRSALSFNTRDAVLVTDFENQTGDPRFDYALGTAFSVSLQQSHRVNIFPHDQLAPILQMMGQNAGQKINRGVGREICQRENIRGLIAASVTRTGEEYELAAQLIDPQTDETVRSYSERSHGEDHLLEALDKISAEVRRDLGESLYQIHRAEMPLAQVTTPSLQALKDYSNGKLLWHAAKYKEGLASFRAAVAADPDFAMANAALGGAYYSFVNNEYSEGQKYYEKALANASRVTPREREIIETEYAEDRGHVPDAIQLYGRYLQEYPDDLEMRFDYAHLLRMNGHAAEGIEQDRQVLRIAPSDAHTYIDMATAYHSLGQLTQSLDAYNKAFQIDPQIRVAGNISREYGFTLVQNGQVGEAEQFFSGLLNDAHLQEPGIRSLALLDLYRGDYESAQKYLEKALKIDTANRQAFSVARVRYLLAVVAAGEGRKQDQIAQLDLIMANFSALEAKVLYGSLVGQAYARAGEVAEAERILAQIAPLADSRSQEQSSYLRILRAEIADAKGESGQALQLLESPQADDPVSTVSITLDALGHTYQLAGDIDQAIASYQKLFELPMGWAGWEPQQQCLEDHYVLAEDYAREGQRTKAISTIEDLLSLWKDADPNLPLKEQAIQLRSSLVAKQ